MVEIPSQVSLLLLVPRVNPCGTLIQGPSTRDRNTGYDCRSQTRGCDPF